jgi:hypothetical protein
MALKKSDLYSSLWRSCDELGGINATQCKDYILTLLFVKYATDKAKADRSSLIDVPPGGSFDDMGALKGDKEISSKGVGPRGIEPRTRGLKGRGCACMGLRTPPDLTLPVASVYRLPGEAGVSLAGSLTTSPRRRVSKIHTTSPAWRTPARRHPQRGHSWQLRTSGRGRRRRERQRSTWIWRSTTLRRRRAPDGCCGRDCRSGSSR